MLVGLLLLLGFAYSTNYYELRYVDDEIEPYVQEFVRDCAKYSKTYQCDKLLNNLYATFFVKQGSWLNQGKDSIAGMSAGWHGTLPTIVYLNRDYWNRSSDIQRKALVYHELGHSCLLEDHNPSPYSIMYYSSVPDNYLRLYWEGMVKELFAGGFPI